MSSSSPFHSIQASLVAQRQAVHRAPLPAHNAPAGTFVPGTKVTVGNHRVVIEKYLSEGGFAHVYLVRVPKSGSDNTDVAVLKRVAVPDKESLANMRTEVETMKKLKGHKHIVTYIDSHASQLKGGGYEVFLLMEYCSGGGLIDFMNTRLQHRLTEPEILKIFSDVAEGVACMHYLKPPLLHRDLKVENVLISASGSSRIYKLCDFGSTAPPRPAATSAAEGRLIEDDVQRHTTLQYRSPEMIDVYRKQPIDEKSDIWALGVLLYKLCYYTTPFEAQGQMAILNASFTFPPYPPFSDRTKKLISSMLRENPQQRPTIYEVVKEACSMRNVEVPIKDIYANRSRSEARRNEKLPSPDPMASPSLVVGIHKSPSIQPTQAIPEITPMRRGRPTAPLQQQPVPKPVPSPARGTSDDPFAALDSTSVAVRSAAADELAAKFPPLEEFTILQDKGSNFQFKPTSPSLPKQESLSQRVTAALADDAFARPVSSGNDPGSARKANSASVSRSTSLKRPTPSETKAQQLPRSPQPSQVPQSSSQKPVMVSTGTMTSPPLSSSPSKVLPPRPFPEITKRPIWRVPQADAVGHHRALSQPRAPKNVRSSLAPSEGDHAALQRPAFLDSYRSKSSTSIANLAPPKSPASSRPSLEGQRPSVPDYSDPIHRSQSASGRARPSSVHVESNLDYLRERETVRGRPSNDLSKIKSATAAEPDTPPQEETNIESNVDFLRAIEDADSSKKKDRRSGSSGSGTKHRKRSSLPSISLSNTKNILAGKFGDAFRRFEGNTGGPPEPRTPSPSFEKSAPLTPIAGSEATGGRSDDESAIDETEDLPPEVRRELERRRLSQEEKRVAEAAAEYRRRLAEGGGGGGGGPARASTIQNRVKALLDEGSKQQQPPPVRTAEGYGRFTEAPRPPEQLRHPNPPLVARRPAPMAAAPNPGSQIPLRQPLPADPPVIPASAPPTAQPRPLSRPKPGAPPKPTALRTGGQFDGARVPSPSPAKPAARLLEEEVSMPVAGNGEDWEESFSKRYPSLSGLEMVEREV
ncbi:NAK/BIKE protein kinase [Coniosporium apollinis CBS 100218]|uniref:non-specific serine/threonine protein kinase n=1 Tax=Coniosporium apollinis (strain CBS 100218) TaxID=1168221 RepID=R7YNI3_CONA1|nr:NAK/BIKE protein kinase [Coniosporium apollinis CBS 100218]EON63457.1 NAK/BIKE protein kinase [Coniosporium apollinis CBS 100218]